MNEKDKAAYELLKSKRILRDSALTPLMRVTLRSIKDFAKPIEVTLGSNKELFWKWYLLPNDVASEEIKKVVKAGPASKEATAVSPKEVVKEAPKIVEKKPEPAPLVKQDKEEAQQTLEKEPKKKKPVASSAFLDEANAYFEKNKIEVLETDVIKKNTELDFIVKIPSPVGSLRYYCKARSKKKLTHADLSAVYVSGESKKLPILLLIKGELNKKAEGMLDNEFKNMSVQKL